MSGDAGPPPAPGTRAQLEAFGARVRGCLLGGAVGDALGSAELGVPGGGGYGLVTADTQLTLFTVEGLIRAGVRADRGIGFTIGVLDHAYRRWLDTQRHPAPQPTGGPDRSDGWLRDENWLYSQRAPGAATLAALAAANPASYGSPAANDSKGAQAVARSAPIGLLPFGDRVFDLAAQAAGFTHGHRTAQVAAGALALLVARLADGLDLRPALESVVDHLLRQSGHDETSRALRRAADVAEAGEVTPESLEPLGHGHVADEALALALCAALALPCPDQMRQALSLAVTHPGNTASTGAICGSILGTLHGDTAVPPELAFEVEGRGTILTLAQDFGWEFTAGPRLHGDRGPDTRWTTRYPGW